MTTHLVAYTDLGTIVLGWGATAAVVGAYALLLVRRGKRLSRAVPPEDRRWS